VVRIQGQSSPEAAKRISDLPKEKPSLYALRSKASELARSCNDDPGAWRAYEQALKLYPGDAPLLNSVAWFLLTAKDEKVRDAQRAVPMAREAVKLTNEENGNILDTLAKALHDTGQLADAAKYAKLAAERQPNNEEIVGRSKEYAADYAKACPAGAAEKRE
jgi:predicted Zn-dependent protease